MTGVLREVKIDAPKDKVWATLADLAAIQNYNPMVARSYYTSDTRTGTGATRHCDFSPMGSVEERVVAWEEGKEYSIEVYDSHLMPMTVKAHFELQPAETGTKVSVLMEYTMMAGKIGALAEKAMQRQVAKMAEGMLAGLKHYVETGEAITPQVLKKVRKAAVAV